MRYNNKQMQHICGVASMIVPPEGALSPEGYTIMLATPQRCCICLLVVHVCTIGLVLNIGGGMDSAIFKMAATQDSCNYILFSKYMHIMCMNTAKVCFVRWYGFQQYMSY